MRNIARLYKRVGRHLFETLYRGAAAICGEIEQAFMRGPAASSLKTSTKL